MIYFCFVEFAMNWRYIICNINGLNALSTNEIHVYVQSFKNWSVIESSFSNESDMVIVEVQLVKLPQVFKSIIFDGGNFVER